MNEPDLNIGKIIRLILMQSKFVLSVALLFLGLSVAYYFYTDKTYEFKSLIQLNTNQSTSQEDILNDLYIGNNSPTNIGSITKIYTSRSNLLKVIDKNNLNFDVEGLSFDQKNIFIKYQPLNSEDKFFISLLPSKYKIYDKDKKQILELDYGVDYLDKKISIYILKPTFLVDEVLRKIEFIDPKIFYKNLSRRINLVIDGSARTRSTFNTVIEVIYKSKDRKEGIKTLNDVNEEYISSSIARESKEASKALDFLDSSIEQLEKILSQKKNSLRDFKENIESVDVNLETESLITSENKIQEELNKIDIEITKAENLYTSENRIFRDLISQRDTLFKQKGDISQKIKNLPQEQQQYIDKFREVERDEEIYSGLLQRRLEYSLKEASTLANIRIIDEAFEERVISPTISFVFISTLFGVIIGLLSAIYRGVYFLPITNPAELSDNGFNQSILGVVPHVSNAKEMDSDDMTRLEQAIESLIVNLEQRLSTKENKHQCKIITLTSPTPHNGKSYLSYKISKEYSKVGKRVCVFDADFKRGDLHKLFDIQKISQKDFSEITIENIDKLKHENVTVIPKISGLRSSFEFLHTNAFQEKLKLLKETHDVIIFDTAPLLSVSDTSMLASLADLNMLIVRHGVSKIHEIRQAISIYSQTGTDLDGMTYNDYQKPTSYYGYYNLYGNYQYQYYAKKYLYEDYEYTKES